MSVGAASGLLSSGAVGDDHGRCRVCGVGALSMAFASLQAALAPDGVALVIARILDRLDGAAVLACSLILLGQTGFPTGWNRAALVAAGFSLRGALVVFVARTPYSVGVAGAKRREVRDERERMSSWQIGPPNRTGEPYYPGGRDHA